MFFLIIALTAILFILVMKRLRDSSAYRCRDRRDDCSRLCTSQDLGVDAIRAPHRYRDIVEPLLPARAPDYYESGQPRFAATVNFGRRFEPWIVDLQSLQPAQP